MLVKTLKKPITSTFIAIFLGIFFASLILAFAGYAPFDVMKALFNGIFSKPKNIANVIIKSTPIIITGLSVAFAFKTGMFNIGAEGQFIAGSVAATITGLSLNFPPFLQIPIIILAGCLAGALLGGIIGSLKAKFGIHEVITSIMLNWIAFHLSNFVVNCAAFHKPNSSNTYTINENGFTTLFYKWKTSEEGLKFLKEHSLISEFFLKTDFNIGIFLAIILAIFISFFLFKMTKGYELRALGLNSQAAEFAGINIGRNTLYAMLIAGSISGLAGALVITGASPHNISDLSMFENNGFNGLSVALIAGSSPIGCIASGLFLGGLLYGGQFVQMQIGTPSEIINIMIGTIVFFIALAKFIPILVDKFSKHRIKSNTFNKF
jgi:simple sugar transport system permease protein